MSSVGRIVVHVEVRVEVRVQVRVEVRVEVHASLPKLVSEMKLVPRVLSSVQVTTVRVVVRVLSGK